MSIYNCRSCPGPGTLTCPRHQAYFWTPITVIAMDPPYFPPYTNAPETSTAGNMYEPQYNASGYPSQAPPYGHPMVSVKPCLRDFSLPKTFISILGSEMADRLSLFHFCPLRCFLLSSTATESSWCVEMDFPLMNALAYGPSLSAHRLSSPSSSISTLFSWIFAAISRIC